MSLPVTDFPAHKGLRPKTNTLQLYCAYKPSDVEWLGDVSVH